MKRDKPWYHKIGLKDLTVQEENQILSLKAVIAKHKNSILKWEGMIQQAKEAVIYNEKRILEVQGLKYYVYVVFVNSVAMYVGKGKGDRYKHPVSGCSSCPELNRDHFSGKYIEVMFAEEALSEQSALNLEANWIYQINSDYHTIYNKNIPDKGKYVDESMDYFYHHKFKHAIDNSYMEGVTIKKPKYSESNYE